MMRWGDEMGWDGGGEEGMERSWHGHVVITYQTEEIYPAGEFPYTLPLLFPRIRANQDPRRGGRGRGGEGRGEERRRMMRRFLGSVSARL